MNENLYIAHKKRPHKTLRVHSFGRTMLYMCIECHIYVNMYHVSTQGIDEHMINVYCYY